MIPQDFEKDIGLDLATSAHAGTSHSPEKRGEMEIHMYADQLRRDLASFPAAAHELPTFVSAWEDYRNGFAKRTRAMLEAKSRCISTLVAGPANFNTSRARKRGDAADRYTAALVEYREACLRELHRIAFPNEAPVACGDEDAVERLRAKLDEAEKFQAEAKKINAEIRKLDRLDVSHESKIVGLAQTLGTTYQMAAEFLKPDALGNVGVPKYKLTNNGAEIRRLKARIETVSKAKAEPTVEEFHTTTEIVFTNSPADNRITLRFPGKPDEATRAALKAHGFRWAPTEGRWKAYRKHHSITFARALAAKGSP